MPPKATLARPRESIGQQGKQSSSGEFAVSPRNHCQTGRPHRAVVHDPHADTYDAASAIVASKVRGSRTLNSVNSPIWLSTLIVPPCSWVTMS